MQIISKNKPLSPQIKTGQVLQFRKTATGISAIAANRVLRGFVTKLHQL